MEASIKISKEGLGDLEEDCFRVEVLAKTL
jgi:hypothetical protein